MGLLLPGPGWFADPGRRHRSRYWNGEVWTTWVADFYEPFDESASVITLHRRSAAAGVLTKYVVVIDGQIVGRIRDGETLTFAVAPGRHRVRVKQFGAASREIEVVGPPEVRLHCGPRAGLFGNLGLTLVRPRRALGLAPYDVDDRLSRPLAALAALAWFVPYAAASMLFHRM